MQPSQTRAVARLSALFILAGCGLCAGVQAQDRCVRVKFTDGKAIAIQSKAVKHLNAVLEWPSMRKVYGIAIVPPAGNYAAEVSSIVVEPVSLSASSKSRSCNPKTDASSCASFLIAPDVSASVYFVSEPTQAREEIVHDVRDYLDKQVQACL